MTPRDTAYEPCPDCRGRGGTWSYDLTGARGVWVPCARCRAWVMRQAFGLTGPCTYCHDTGFCAPQWRCVCGDPPWFEATLNEIMALPEVPR